MFALKILLNVVPAWFCFVPRSFFCKEKAVFMRLKISCGTTIAVKIGQAVVDLKLEDTSELDITNYHLKCYLKTSSQKLF